jgi:hypothetical protein
MSIDREHAIANAKLVLKQAGYFVDNLWHINDVQHRFECDDDTAQEILNDVLTSDWCFERINEAIYDVALMEGLTSKD